MKAVSGVFSIVAGVIAMINFILFLSFVLERLSQALPGLSRQIRDLIADAFSQPPPAIDPPVRPPTKNNVGR